MKVTLALLLVGSAVATQIVDGPLAYKQMIKESDAKLNESLIAPLIVGGVEVSPKYKYEFVAGMRSTSSGNSFCGGTLIASNWVLTAAHCLSVNWVSVNTHSRGGSNDGVQKQVLESVRHPSYGAFTSDYDFGLLRIDNVTAAEATPALLAAADESDEAVGRTATVIGWGATREGGASSSVLLEVDVDIVSNAACNSALGGVTDRMICAGGIRGYDACQGDSGGPFFTSKDSNPILVGAVSWGIGCARDGLPGVYARVSAVRDWIDSTIGGSATWVTL